MAVAGLLYDDEDETQPRVSIDTLESTIHAIEDPVDRALQGMQAFNVDDQRWLGYAIGYINALTHSSASLDEIGMVRSIVDRAQERSLTNRHFKRSIEELVVGQIDGYSEYSCGENKDESVSVLVAIADSIGLLKSVSDSVKPYMLLRHQRILNPQSINDLPSESYLQLLEKLDLGSNVDIVTAYNASRLISSSEFEINLDGNENPNVVYALAFDIAKKLHEASDKQVDLCILLNREGFQQRYSTNQDAQAIAGNNICRRLKSGNLTDATTALALHTVYNISPHRSSIKRAVVTHLAEGHYDLVRQISSTFSYSVINEDINAAITQAGTLKSQALNPSDSGISNLPEGLRYHQIITYLQADSPLNYSRR